MSMNLHCKQVELWQTPTKITYMCMTFAKGKVTSVKGKRAAAALKRYLWWACLMDLVWTGTKEELREEVRIRRVHEKEVLQAIKDNPRRLEVFIM